MSNKKEDKFYLMGGIIYEKKEGDKHRQICILMDDDKGENKKLLLEALNSSNYG